MKKTLILLTILAMLCSLTGCQKPVQDIDTIATLPGTTDQTLPLQSEPIHLPLYSASLPTVSETIHADDGQDLYRALLRPVPVRSGAVLLQPLLLRG